MKKKCGLLIVNMQIDFCPGGAMPVPRAHEIIPTLNKYINLFIDEGLPIFASRAWYPQNSSRFNTMGGLWPVHCLQDSDGARFHPMLHLSNDTVILSNGIDPKEEGCSVFDARHGEDMFNDILKRMEIRELYVGGLAIDDCLKQTVYDAMESGYKIYLLEDAVKKANFLIGDANQLAGKKKRKETVCFDQVESMILLKNKEDGSRDE